MFTSSSVMTLFGRLASFTVLPALLFCLDTRVLWLSTEPLLEAVRTASKWAWAKTRRCLCLCRSRSLPEENNPDLGKPAGTSHGERVVGVHGGWRGEGAMCVVWLWAWCADLAWACLWFWARQACSGICGMTWRWR
jgi:hypothetical protein